MALRYNIIIYESNPTSSNTICMDIFTKTTFMLKKNKKADIKTICLNSGWYWGSISANEAREALQKRSEGTFLMRDSSHPQFMLALSVKTRCGPTSIRIKYCRGSFWLDSISPDLPHLQSFPDVLSLIQNYTASGHTKQRQRSNDIHPQTKPDPTKHTDSDSGVPLELVRPLHKPEAFSSLQHLTRLAINRHTKCPDHLPLPKPLLHYLQDYPFHIWGSLSLWCRTQRLGRGSGSPSLLTTHCESWNSLTPKGTAIDPDGGNWNEWRAKSLYYCCSLG